MSTPLIVMGVQGCGKSTIGRMLAERLGEPFFDGDDLHSEESKAKMGAGVPLTDTDREPWLRRIAELIASEAAAGRHVIIGWPDNRRRDAENLAPTAKHLTDGLVDSGWLSGDDDTRIVESRWSSHVHGKRGVYLVTIRLEATA